MAIPMKMIMGGVIAAVSVVMVFFIIDSMITGITDVTEDITGAFVSGLKFSDIPTLNLTETLDLLPRPSNKLTGSII